MDLLKVSVIKRSEGVFIVSPDGSIDSDTYELLQKRVDALMQPPPKAVIFDMQFVKYISSMGLKVILRTKEAVERAGGTVLLINLQPQISKVFDIVKAIPSQNIFINIEDMDRYLAAIQAKEVEKRKSAQ